MAKIPVWAIPGGGERELTVDYKNIGEVWSWADDPSDQFRNVTLSKDSEYILIAPKAYNILRAVRIVKLTFVEITGLSVDDIARNCSISGNTLTVRAPTSTSFAAFFLMEIKRV